MNIKIKSEKNIYIKKLSRVPIDTNDFIEWLIYKAEELGTGRYVENYLADEPENDISVEFEVETQSVSVENKFDIHLETIY